jgi:hypothetical protein
MKYPALGRYYLGGLRVLLLLLRFCMRFCVIIIHCALN